MSYPASGFRASDSGGLGSVGTYGYAWSSSPDAASNDGGAYLNFGSARVNPENYNSRTLGFPVRCVPDNKSGFSIRGCAALNLISLIRSLRPRSESRSP